jgi:hypothetical protein
MNRRALPSGLVGAGLGLAVAAPAAASPADRQLGALERLANKLGRSVEDLAGIRADWVPPVDPDVPATLTALLVLRGQALEIVRLVDELALLTLPR